MAIKILEAQNRGVAGSFYQIHIDDSKMIDGKPDPAYVMEFSYGKDVTEAKALAAMKIEAQARLASLTMTNLPSKGTVIS